MVKGVMIEGVWCSDPVQLDKDASVKEIKNVIWDCGSSKAPGTWANVVSTIHDLHNSNIIPNNSIRIKLECGSKVRFWKDVWLGDSVLYQTYNRHIEGGGIRDMFTDLTAEIQQIQLISDEDSWQWLVGKNGVFTVGETRKHIDSFILSVLDTRTTWSKFLPRRINVFMWRLALDRLPHIFHLSRRGFDIDSILCQLCSRAAKTKDHFFSFCEIACDVWRLVRVWCGIFDSHLNSISSWLAWIDGLSSASVKQERMYVILVTSCCISLEASDIAVLIPFL
ncbi:RNA-directed DNA polymerase, eukaryota [Tanacetum coccineum]